MFNPASKTFWLGFAMVIAGFFKLLGLDIPVLADLINSIYPNMDGGSLISAGFALLFVRDAVAKVATATPSKN
jgi:hypothetical protein